MWLFDVIPSSFSPAWTKQKLHGVTTWVKSPEFKSTTPHKPWCEHTLRDIIQISDDSNPSFEFFR